MCGVLLPIGSQASAVLVLCNVIFSDIIFEVCCRWHGCMSSSARCVGYFYQLVPKPVQQPVVKIMHFQSQMGQFDFSQALSFRLAVWAAKLASNSCNAVDLRLIGRLFQALASL